MNQLTDLEIQAINDEAETEAIKDAGGYCQKGNHSMDCGCVSFENGYVIAAKKYSELERQKVKGLLTALEEIKGMKLLPGETDCRYAYNRCWHIADKALTNYNNKH